LSGVRSTLPSLEALDGEVKNLPLNFEVQLTDTSADYFEKNPVFSSLYTMFPSAN